MKHHSIALALIVWAAPAAAQEPMDSVLARFYAARLGQPAWVIANRVSNQAQLFLEATRSPRDGLDPTDYQVPALNSLLDRRLSEDDAWRLDSLLSRAFLVYARDVSLGRVEPSAIDTQWTAAPRPIDVVTLLNRAADGEAGDVLAELEPPQPGYDALRAAFQRYRELAARGPWPSDLRLRLAAERYDISAGLRAAVREFQQLHGLSPDGIVGPATRAALDVPAAVRAEQIALNLERWRWLPRDLGQQYIMVNSAAFTVELVNHDTVAWTARAIVGRLDWPTPIVSSVATALLFRPVWKVPRIIAARELLPLIQRDSSYLSRERFHVYGDSGLPDAELDARAIDWSAVTESTFAYQLAQEPGGHNPLGGVKLVSWNPFSVFLHDTPARPLFSERLRTFSHGCVRVERAATLVAKLLPDWSADSIRAAMSRGRERWVRLPEPIPVHLVYWTAWVTENGLVAFGGDPYNWDDELARALDARRASRVSTIGVSAP